MTKITVNQLKRLIREAMEENMSDKNELYSLYSDMYKELYNIRPRWLHPDNVSVEQLRDMVAHLEEIYPEEMDRQKQDEEEEKEYFEQMVKDEEEKKREKTELGFEGDDEEGLPMRSGMGRRLTENLKAIVREAYEAACMECGYEESVEDESVQSKDMDHRKDVMGLEEKAIEEILAEAKKSMRLGQGGRFKKLTDKLKSQGKSEESAKAIAASIGRKKYGKAKMAHWSEAGKKRANKE